VRLIRVVRRVVEARRGPALAPFRFDGAGRIAIDLLLHFARHVDLLSETERPSVRACALRAFALGTKDLRGTTPIESRCAWLRLRRIQASFVLTRKLRLSASSSLACGAGGIRTRDPHTASVMRSHCATAPMLSARAR